MINVSDAVKQQLNADMRWIKCKVKIYYDGLHNPPTIYTSDDMVIDASILEESQADSNSPLGVVSSNEFTLALNNYGGLFTVTNKNSPLYGKIVSGTRVEVFFPIEIAPDVFEDITMGVYFTEEWHVATSGLTAALTCYDRLYTLKQQDVPSIPVYRNITVQKLFINFFNSLGLVRGVDYEVDDSLQYMLDYAWIPQGKVGAALQMLAESCCCYISVNRYNRIVVNNRLRTKPTDCALTDNNQIFSIECKPSYDDVYSGVEIVYSVPTLDVSKELLTLENISMPNGELALSQLAFKNGPAVTISAIKVINGKNTRVSYYNIKAFSLDLTLRNPGPAETITIVVEGRTLGLTDSSYKYINEEIADIVGERIFTIKSYLLQNDVFIKDYARVLSQMYSDPEAKVKVICKGYPILELSDTLTVDSASDNLPLKSVLPTRMNYDFKDGLSGTIECVATSTRTVVDTLFIGPGMTAQIIRAF